MPQIPADTWTWLGPLCLIVVGAYLVSLRNKINSSVSKEDLKIILEEIDSDMSEIREQHREDREENRRKQDQIFTKLDLQQTLLTQVSTQIGMLLEMMKQTGGKGHGFRD